MCQLSALEVVVGANAYSFEHCASIFPHISHTRHLPCHLSSVEVNFTVALIKLAVISLPILKCIGSAQVPQSISHPFDVCKAGADCAGHADAFATP